MIKTVLRPEIGDAAFGGHARAAEENDP